MDREFERYRGGPNEAASKRLHVTISPAKLILLNRNVYHLLGKPAAVYLNFSRTRDIIAIEPASPRLPESFPVLPTGHSWRINAAPLLPPFWHRYRHDAQIHPPRDRRQCPLPKTRRNRLGRRPEAEETRSELKGNLTHERETRWTGYQTDEKGEVTFKTVEPPDWR